MSYDKVVDSAQLEADLTTVADRLRAESGVSGPLAWPADYLAAIGQIAPRAQVSGPAPLRVAVAMARPLRALVQKGKCTVNNGTIQCNNGTLVVPNLVNFCEDNVMVGKYINSSGAISNSSYNFYCDAMIAVEPGADYTMKVSQSIAYFNFIEYDSEGNFVRRKLYGASGKPAGDAITHTMGDNTAFIRWGANPFVNTGVSYENVSEIDWMLTKGDAAQEFVPYGKVIAVGTPEMITVTPGGDTAGAVDLLAVGGVGDTQDIVSGRVERRTEAFVYDGTQTVNEPFISSAGALEVGAIVVRPRATAAPLIEQATPQTLMLMEGANAVEVTGAISAPEMQAEFYGIQEV